MKTKNSEELFTTKAFKKSKKFDFDKLNFSIKIYKSCAVKEKDYSIKKNRIKIFFKFIKYEYRNFLHPYYNTAGEVTDYKVYCEMFYIEIKFRSFSITIRKLGE